MTEQEQLALGSAAWAAYAAMIHTTEPARWPAFAAWAEQHIPGTTWTEQDRLKTRSDAEIFHRMAEAFGCPEDDAGHLPGRSGRSPSASGPGISGSSRSYTGGLTGARYEPWRCPPMSGSELAGMDGTRNHHPPGPVDGRPDGVPEVSGFPDPGAPEAGGVGGIPRIKTALRYFLLASGVVIALVFAVFTDVWVVTH